MGFFTWNIHKIPYKTNYTDLLWFQSVILSMIDFQLSLGSLENYLQTLSPMKCLIIPGPSISRPSLASSRVLRDLALSSFLCNKEECVMFEINEWWHSTFNWHALKDNSLCSHFAVKLTLKQTWPQILILLLLLFSFSIVEYTCLLDLSSLFTPSFSSFMS